MQCFCHPNHSAIGICKHCGRGVCTDCLEYPQDVDQNISLSCSPKCAQTVQENEEMNERAKRIYGIGSYKKSTPKIPVAAASFFILAAILCIYVVFEFADNLTDKAIYPLYGLITGLFLVGCFTWYRHSRAGLHI